MPILHRNRAAAGGSAGGAPTVIEQSFFNGSFTLNNSDIIGDLTVALVATRYFFIGSAPGPANVEGFPVTTQENFFIGSAGIFTVYTVDAATLINATLAAAGPTILFNQGSSTAGGGYWLVTGANQAEIVRGIAITTFSSLATAGSPVGLPFPGLFSGRGTSEADDLILASINSGGDHNGLLDEVENLTRFTSGGSVPAENQQSLFSGPSLGVNETYDYTHNANGFNVGSLLLSVAGV